MPKRNKKNKKRKNNTSYLSNFDNVFNLDTSYSYLYNSTTPKEIHDIAIQVFGSTYYIDKDTLQESNLM